MIEKADSSLIFKIGIEKSNEFQIIYTDPTTSENVEQSTGSDGSSKAKPKYVLRLKMISTQSPIHHHRM